MVDRRPPTWLLGAIVALLGWRVGMGAPGPGLDASWNAGLAMAIKDGLQFGTDVVFSYGPLGFLQSQAVWYGDLAVLAFLYSATLYVAFCVALVWALRRLLPALPSALIAFLAVAVLPLLEQSILLAVLVGLGMLERERSQALTNAFVVGGASFAALEALIKLSTGPTIAALFLVALVGLRARWWQILAFLALLALELLLLWLATGQGLAAVPDFLENTWQIVSGYSAAMLRQTDVAPWKVTVATIVAAIVTVLLVVASARARYPDRRARWAGVLLMAVAAFAVFKEGVVRTDAGHLSLYFSTACVLWIAIPWAQARWAWMLAGAAAIAAIGLPVRPPGLPTNLDAVANVRLAADQVGNLVSGSRRADLTAAGRAGMKATYRLDAEARAALRGRTVAIEPWEIGVAWAYGLDWSPLPVLQNYSAYTSALDHLNAAAVESPTGPERILRENEPLVYPEFPTPDLDDRFLGWDPPAQARAVLCNFAPLHTTERWQVLGRTANRCGSARFVGSAEASPGAKVQVPAPGRDEVVFVRVHGVDVSGLERLSTALFHARLRRMVLNGSQSYRLVPGTAADGLVLRGNGVAEGAPFSPIPQAKTLAVTGAGGDLRFDFFRMRMGSLVVRHPRR